MTYSEFTWFEKITRVSDLIEDENDRAAFILAVVDYGTKGVEPDLPYPLNGFFEGIREDISNSVNRRKEKRGGRPRKHGVQESEKQAETPRCENEKLGVSEIEEHQVSENENTHLYKPSQAKPYPSQSKGKPKERVIFSPPSLSEVESFWQSESLRGSPVEFHDYFTAQGWRLSNGNHMKDWRAAARNWSRRQAKWEGGHDAIDDAIGALGEVGF